MWRRHPLTRLHLANLRELLDSLQARLDNASTASAVPDDQVRVLAVEVALLRKHIKLISEYA